MARKKQDFIVDDTFISSDPGNGMAGAYRIQSGRVKSAIVPHARARVTGTKLNADMGGQNIAEYADFMGQRYGYGDNIWNLTDAPIDTAMGTEERYGGAYHIFLTLLSIAELGVKSGSELTLIVPAPPGMLNRVAPKIKEAFLAGESGSGDGVWTIQRRSDKTLRKYTINRVICLPEGAGAYAAYRYDLTGEVTPLLDENSDDMLGGRVCVLDLGNGTGDTFLLFDGNANPDAIQHASDTRAGIRHNVLQPVLDDILNAVPNAQHLRTAQVDAVLRRYLAATNDDEREQAATMRVAGKTINIEMSILNATSRYAEWLCDNVIAPQWNNGTDAVVAAGGGWLLVESFVRDRYPDRLILTPDQFAHTKKIALYDLNGYGGLVLASAVLKMQQA